MATFNPPVQCTLVPPPGKVVIDSPATESQRSIAFGGLVPGTRFKGIYSGNEFVVTDPAIDGLNAVCLADGRRIRFGEDDHVFPASPPPAPAGIEWGQTPSRSGFYWFRDRLCLDIGGSCVDVETGARPHGLVSNSTVYPVDVTITPAFGPQASGG